MLGCGRPRVLALRRRGQRDRRHPGDLGRHHVHDHAGGQRGQPAGDVEPDPADRDHPLADLGPRGQVDLDGRRAELGLADPPPAGDRGLEGRAQFGVELVGRRGQRVGRRPGTISGTTWSNRARSTPPARRSPARPRRRRSDGRPPPRRPRRKRPAAPRRHSPAARRAARRPRRSITRSTAESTEAGVPGQYPRRPEALATVARCFPGSARWSTSPRCSSGPSIGLLLGHRLPLRTRETVTDALGLVTLLIGALSAAEVTSPDLAAAVGRSAPVLIVLGALLLGGIAGSLIDIEARLEQFGDWLRRRLAAPAGAGLRGADRGRSPGPVHRGLRHRLAGLLRRAADHPGFAVRRAGPRAGPAAAEGGPRRLRRHRLRGLARRRGDGLGRRRSRSSRAR